MSPEITMARPTSQKRIDANRRNACKSTGPRTPEGKSRSRFNRLQHGLAATVPVLPGEDPAAFQARVDAVVESFASQNTAAPAAGPSQASEPEEPGSSRAAKREKGPPEIGPAIARGQATSICELPILWASRPLAFPDSLPFFHGSLESTSLWYSICGCTIARTSVPI